MRIKNLILSTAMATVFLAVNASAISVSFVEGLEGSDVVVSSTGFSGQGTPPSSTTGPESATFTGYQFTAGVNLGSGAYGIGLFESPGGALSDYVTVTWSSGFIQTGYQTRFDVVFKSDVEGAILLPPINFPGSHIEAVEDGTLQTFRVPSTVFSLDIGIQSDVEPTSKVPDGGTTLLLLSCSVLTLGAFRRLQIA